VSNEPNTEIREPESLAGAPPPSQDERNLALWTHLGGFLTSFILPLILWQMNRDKSRFVSRHAVEALNFQIALVIYYLVCAALMLVLIGFLLIFVLLAFEIVVIIQGCMAAGRGEMYRYPMSIRFVKE
jgi:uncharacterized Tic20 family protein